MAGVGFVLRRLAARDDLAGPTAAYAAAAAVTAGPWLITILAIVAAEAWGRVSTIPWEHETFRIVLSYGFCFSLVLTSPFALVATRMLADRLFARRADEIGALFLDALAAALLVQTPLALAFWWLVPDLDAGTRLAAVALHGALVGLWMAAAFLSVLRDFATVLVAFALGMGTAAVAAALAAHPFGSAGLVASFALGAALVLALGGARLLAEFPWTPPDRRALWREARPFGSLALYGLIAAAAPWADKWVLWLSPLGETSATRLVHFPAYDSAMFLAYLAMVPGGAAFFVALETGFFLAFRRYFGEVLRGAPLDRIEARRLALVAVVSRAALSLLLLQALVTAVALLASPALSSAGALTAAQEPVFRFGVLGALFHVPLAALLAVMGYLDVRRDQIAVAAAFLVLNAGLAWALVPLGPGAQGLGYVVATAASLLLAVALTGARLRGLVYLTFIANNPSVRRPRSVASPPPAEEEDGAWRSTR